MNTLPILADVQAGDVRLALFDAGDHGRLDVIWEDAHAEVVLDEDALRTLAAAARRMLIRLVERDEQPDHQNSPQG